MDDASPFDIMESITPGGGAIAAAPAGGNGSPSSPAGVVANGSESSWCIPNVKILGTSSKNGAHRYSESCLAAAVELYEGCAVCNDHTSALAPDNLNLCTAPIRNPDDILGYFKGVRYVPGDGLRGNLHFTRRGELAESVMVASRENPKLYGFSHHVPRNGFRSHMEGNVKVIDAITAVVSVDLVTNPMTNHGLFAGVRPADVSDSTQGANPMKFTDLLASICQLPAEKRRVAKIMADLKESMGDGADMADPAVEVGNEATKPEDKIKAGFQTMMNDIVEGYMSDGDDSRLVARIKAAAKACGMMLKGDEPKAETKESAEEGDKSAMPADDKKESADMDADDKKESVQSELLGDGAADLLESAGIAITPKLLKTLRSVTKEQAEGLLESVKAEKQRADDLERRLKVLKPDEVTRSAARGGDLLAGGTKSNDKGEYKPMLLQTRPTKAMHSLVSSNN